MPAKPDYRFSFTITDETTGDVIVSDHVSFNADSVKDDGACEAVDDQVARDFRYFHRIGRARHEAENYRELEQQYVTRAAGQIRAVAEAK